MEFEDTESLIGRVPQRQQMLYCRKMVTLEDKRQAWASQTRIAVNSRRPRLTLTCLQQTYGYISGIYSVYIYTCKKDCDPPSYDTLHQQAMRMGERTWHCLSRLLGNRIGSCWSNRKGYCISSCQSSQLKMCLLYLVKRSRLRRTLCVCCLQSTMPCDSSQCDMHV